MKKNFFLGFIALTALTVTSCSNDEVMEAVPQKQAIEFGTYLGRDAQGRGVVLNNDNLENFGVFASYTGQTPWATTNGFNFMYNQMVEKTTSDVWTYNPIKYWPTTKEDKISFWAYAPYESKKSISVVSKNSDTSYPQIKYTLTDSNLADAEDFTADVLMDEEREGNGTSIDSNDRTVAFKLMHELSRISFQAKLDRKAYNDAAAANKTFVNIKNIKFSGAQFASEATYSFATSDNTRGTWSPEAVEAILDITELLETTTDNKGGYKTEGTRVYDESLVTLFGNDKYLFHIPTNSTTGTATEGDVTITISYDIVTVDGALKDGHSVTPAVKKFALPEGSLKQGSAYNYILTFGLNEIKLSASVADWVENTVYDDVDWTITDVK